jgi:hypothetical protein
VASEGVKVVRGNVMVRVRGSKGTRLGREGEALGTEEEGDSEGERGEREVRRAEGWSLKVDGREGI